MTCPPRERRRKRFGGGIPTGTGWLSAYYAEDDDAVDDLAADLLERFPILRIYDPAALSAGGIEVVPTFRAPHVTLALAARRWAGGSRNRASRAPGEPLP